MFLHKIGPLATLNRIFVSLMSIYVNKGVPYNCCLRAFKFLVRNAYEKGRKIKGLDVCDKVIVARSISLQLYIVSEVKTWCILFMSYKKGFICV